jgi:beta-glucosidase
MNKNHTDIQEIISRMTLEQKARMCSGKDFWHLEGFEELGIPSIMVTDGPHGLRKQTGTADHAGLADSVPAVCFPTASAAASSWDEALLQEMGEHLGDECRQEKVAILLGPGANIKRSPLCGRNFEYFSEDPFLSGKLAAAMIRGVQSRGIGTSLKHFAANNQEKRRMSIDTLVDDRALREIYLAGFEIAVKEGKPDTVMNAYNRLNGEFCSEHSQLLTEILKNEWGHEGFVVTDWGAENDRVQGLKAGQELEMPGPAPDNTRLIIKAVDEGELDLAVLDAAIARMLSVILKTSSSLEDEFQYDEQAHHDKARQILRESAVLLKNTGILPLATSGSLAVIGEFAVKPRYQGSGSSLIQPTRLDNAWDAINALAGEHMQLSYAPGYVADREEPHEQRIAEAVSVAGKADIAVVFAGLPDISESEGFDRAHIDLPESHTRLIEAVRAANPRTIVVLSNGAPVTMPWLDGVEAVLETYLGGQAWGSATADLLFGKANPCGKLAESFPRRLEDVPASVNFPGGTNSVAYAESLYVGYRFYDKAGTELLFPFGHGLSYTSFEYRDLRLSGPDEQHRVRVSLTVTNTGAVAGKEIVQIYIRDRESSAYRPEKELKGFAKISLEPGQQREVVIDLDRRAFSFWDSGSRSWVLEAGDFDILAGASASDIRLDGSIRLENGDDVSDWAAGLRDAVPGYFEPTIRGFADLSSSGDFARLMNRPLPPKDIPPGQPFDRLSTIGDIRGTFVGGLIYWAAGRSIRKFAGKNADAKTIEMMRAMITEMPMKSMAMMGGGMSRSRIDGILDMVNGKFFRGLAAIFRGDGD